MATQTYGHSAKVAITLVSQGRQIPVAHVGNSGLLVRVLDEPVPPGEATLVIEIDDSKKQHRIVLPDGVSETNKFVKFF